MEANKIKVVFTVVERNGKSFWVRIGIGAVNRDGSINLKLDAVPVNGSLQIRDYEPYEDRLSEREAAREPGRAGARSSGLLSDGAHA